jgi:hypothetical protein
MRTGILLVYYVKRVFYLKIGGDGGGFASIHAGESGNSNPSGMEDSHATYSGETR